MRSMNEANTVAGDMYETPNGNRYLVLSNDQLAYLGNRVHSRSTGLAQKTGSECKMLGRVKLPAYAETVSEEEETLECWDEIQGIERIPAPLPAGCTCNPNQLAAIIECPVHRVTALAPHPLTKIHEWILDKLKDEWIDLSKLRPSGPLEMEVQLVLSGRAPNDPRRLAQQSHAAIVTLAPGSVELTATHSAL